MLNILNLINDLEIISPLANVCSILSVILSLWQSFKNNENKQRYFKNIKEIFVSSLSILIPAFLIYIAFSSEGKVYWFSFVIGLITLTLSLAILILKFFSIDIFGMFKAGKLIHNLDFKTKPPENVVGRKTEIESISEKILRSYKPVVIASGFGGIGKSTIAQVVAWNFLKQRKPFNLIVWIDARHYNDAQVLSFDSILDKIAFAENRVSEIPKITDEEIKSRQVVSLLTKYRCLLIIDNYEDLKKFEKEEARLSNFLSSLPSQPEKDTSQTYIKVLITSRELSSGLSGHHITNFRVKKLPFPESREMMLNRIEEINKTRSEKLQLSDEQLKYIWDKLVGLPKYMELAIEQLKDVSFEEWSNRINTINISPDDQENQSNVYNDLFRYSWDRFSESYKKILLTTTYFIGDAPSKTLQVVCGLSATDFVDTLTKESNTFIEKSNKGYTVHPLTHNFCKAMIYSADWSTFKSESDIRFIEYYVRFTDGEKENIEAQAKEIQNIVTSSKLAEVLVKWEDAIQLRKNVPAFMRHLGYWHEEIDITLPAIKACRELKNHELLAKLLVYDLGWLYLRLEKTDHVNEVVNEGLEIFKALNDEKGKAQALRHLGKRALVLGLDKYYEPNKDWDSFSKEVEELYTLSLAIWEKLSDSPKGDPIRIADLKLDFGRFYWLDGKRKECIGRKNNDMSQVEEAFKLYQKSNKLNYEALEIYKEASNKQGITKTYGNLGNTSKEIASYFVNEKKWKDASKEIKKAWRYYELNLENGRKIRRKDELAHAQWGLAEINLLHLTHRELHKNFYWRFIFRKRKIKNEARAYAKESYELYLSLGGTKDINATERLLNRIENL